MKKNRIDALIDKNSVVDKGDGVVEFKGGLVLTDESAQKNGTRYDIKSMDIDSYDGIVFADHNYNVSAIVGESFGIAKRGKKVIAEGVKFAIKESALAQYVHDMVLAGYIKAVSIGTLGRMDFVENDEDEPGIWAIYREARLLEFSFVGIPNNDNAKINAIAKNVYEDAKVNGLDTTELDLFIDKSSAQVDAKGQPIVINVHNHINKEEGINSMTEEEKKAAEAKAAQEKADADAKAAADKAAAEAAANGVAPSLEEISAAVNSAVKPLADRLDAAEKLAKEAFDKGATEPQFVAGNGAPAAGTDAELDQMSWEQRTQLQVESFFKGKVQGDSEALAQLSKINKFHQAKLVKEGIAKNAGGLSFTDFGNFVTSPELITEIQGHRTDFSALLAVFGYKETNALEIAWTNRTGDIDMQVVGMEPGVGGNENLKPISKYGATVSRKELEELAAVTPVCTTSTIFLAVDLLDDVAAGYRTSYDRNNARGVIAALQNAIEDAVSDFGLTGQSVGYTAAGVDTAKEQLEQIRKAIFSISQGNGILIFNEATFGVIWSLLVEVGQGGVLTDTVVGETPYQMLWNKRFVVVPNELMPTIGDDDYKTFVLDGVNVDITHAIFYANPSNWRGRQNGGLRYDLSTEAAYEENGTVKSAYQRNEIVLRGSHFRGTAVPDVTRIAGVRSQDLLVS